MEVAPEVHEIEALAEKASLSMGRVLSHAGVAHSTYTRWRAGKEPKTGTIRKLKAAIEELAAA